MNPSQTHSTTTVPTILTTVAAQLTPIPLSGDVKKPELCSCFPSHFEIASAITACCGPRLRPEWCDMGYPWPSDVVEQV
jgi:hypothetical protein